MKFKIGDKLKPKAGAEGVCGVFAGENGDSIIITNIMDDDELSYSIYNKAGQKIEDCAYCFKERHLEYFDTPKDSWPELKAGDMLQAVGVKDRKVVAVLAEVVFCRPMFSGAEIREVETFLKEDLIFWGYRVNPKVEDPIIEVTPEEIAKWKGVDVSKIKVVNNF